MYYQHAPEKRPGLRSMLFVCITLRLSLNHAKLFEVFDVLSCTKWLF